MSDLSWWKVRNVLEAGLPSPMGTSSAGIATVGPVLSAASLGESGFFLFVPAEERMICRIIVTATESSLFWMKRSIRRCCSLQSVLLLVLLLLVAPETRFVSTRLASCKMCWRAFERKSDGGILWRHVSWSFVPPFSRWFHAGDVVCSLFRAFHRFGLPCACHCNTTRLDRITVDHLSCHP